MTAPAILFSVAKIRSWGSIFSKPKWIKHIYFWDPDRYHHFSTKTRSGWACLHKTLEIFVFGTRHTQSSQEEWRVKNEINKKKTRCWNHDRSLYVRWDVRPGKQLSMKASSRVRRGKGLEQSESAWYWWWVSLFVVIGFSQINAAKWKVENLIKLRQLIMELGISEVWSANIIEYEAGELFFIFDSPKFRQHSFVLSANHQISHFFTLYR